MSIFSKIKEAFVKSEDKEEIIPSNWTFKKIVYYRFLEQINDDNSVANIIIIINTIELNHHQRK